MRLIDESDVIKIVDRHTTEDGKLDDDISVILEEVKTAFDKENVIEELKECANESREYWYNYDEEQAFGEVEAYCESIKIVEKGGIE